MNLFSTGIARHRLMTAALLFLSGLFAFWIYAPGLSGPFLVDDFHNLQKMGQHGGVISSETAINFIFGNSSGMLGRPVSMASFLLSDQHWPGFSPAFKYHNLMFHLLCGVLIFYFVFRLLSLRVSEVASLWIALFVSAFWLFHPLNVSTTLYVIQRMAQLSAIFSLAAMISFIAGRQRLENDNNQGFYFIALSIMVFMPLSVFSKENGVLTLLYILLIEKLFFTQNTNQKIYRYIYWFAIVSPLVVLFVYLLSRWPAFMRNYEFREFSLEERLLTQPRILFDYLRYIFVPTNFGTGLVHDDFPVSKGIFEPLSSFWALLGIFISLAAAFFARNRWPLISFGILFFWSAHILESSFIPLEMYFEHRNYLAMVGPIILLGSVIYGLCNLEEKKLGLLIASIVVFVYLSIASLMTAQSTKSWNNTFDLLTIWATEHPDSNRAQRSYGQLLGSMADWQSESERLLTRARDKFPDDITLPMILMNSACLNDRESSVNIDELVEESRNAKFNGGLVSIAKSFADYYISGDCAAGNAAKAHKVLHNLAELPEMIGLRKAELLYHHAEKYALEGHFGVAISMLDETFKHQQSWLIPFTAGVYSMQAGQFDMALDYLNRALEIDRSSSTVPGLQTEKINKVKNQLVAIMSRNE